MSEWPLIIFTIAIQFAAGLALATTLFDRTAMLPDSVLQPLGLAVSPVAAFGLLASLFHLGRPLTAWKAFLNLDQSRLSIEVLVTLIFVAAAFLYGYAWWADKPGLRPAMGLITSVTGVGAVLASAAVYVVPTQPAWNSGWVPLSFLGTMIALGGCAASAFGSEAPRQLHGGSLAGTIAGSLLILAAAGWMLFTLTRGSADGFAAAQLQSAYHLLTTRYFAWLVLHLLLAVIVPIAVAALLWFAKGPAGLPAWTAPAALVSTLSGAIIGRVLMFVATGPHQPF